MAERSQKLPHPHKRATDRHTASLSRNQGKIKTQKEGRKEAKALYITLCITYCNDQ
jgi:hypothetical protein